MEHEEEITDIAADELDELVAEYVEAKASKIALVRTAPKLWTLIATVPN